MMLIELSHCEISGGTNAIVSDVPVDLVVRDSEVKHTRGHPILLAPGSKLSLERTNVGGATDPAFAAKQLFEFRQKFDVPDQINDSQIIYLAKRLKTSESDSKRAKIFRRHAFGRWLREQKGVLWFGAASPIIAALIMLQTCEPSSDLPERMSAIDQQGSQQSGSVPMPPKRPPF